MKVRSEYSNSNVEFCVILCAFTALRSLERFDFSLDHLERWNDFKNQLEPVTTTQLTFHLLKVRKDVQDAWCFLSLQVDRPAAEIKSF